MTIGEKIKQARKHCGLSQEQLAEKLCVSRSAVAKWETDKGIPDIENLKQLSKILGVSLDQLLAEESSLAIRLPIDLRVWGRGCEKVKKDRLIRHQYPTAVIHTLLGQLTQGIQRQNQEFYLVEQGEEQYFVTVTDTFLECRILEQRITQSQFSLGAWHFIKSNYPVE